jgi:hypothetical protein
MSVIGVDTNGIRNPDNGSPNGILPQQEGLEPDHVVESGDTLYEIWQQAVADGCDCTWEEFLGANQHIDNADWIYPGDPVFYPESSQVDGTDGTDGTNGTDGADGTNGTDGAGEPPPGSNSPEAQAVDSARAERDRAIERYNAVQTPENAQALAEADQALEDAVQAEIEADVAALDPPPSTYEEYQEAVAAAADRVAARYPGDGAVEVAAANAEAEMTSVEYLEARHEEAGQLPPAQSQAARIEGLLEGAREVHESPEAQETAEASQAVADAQAELETQQAEGTPNEISQAEADLAEAEQRLEEAIAAETNARIEASGATSDEQIAEVEDQVRQDMLNRVPADQRAGLEQHFDAARGSAETMRETDAAAEAHAGNPTEYSEETLTDAVTAEIEAGLDAFRARNPDASDDEIQAEAERIGDQIVDRNGNNDDVSDVVETVVNDYD